MDTMLKSLSGKEKVYLAGPMQGYPEFNFPAFKYHAQKLRDKGYYVFSPAERDIARHGGVDISKGNDSGSLESAEKDHGFSLREALRDDTNFICMEATAIALMPGWEYSSGAGAEFALAKALKLRFIYL